MSGLYLYCCVKMAKTLGVGGKMITVNENKNSHRNAGQAFLSGKDLKTRQGEQTVS